MKIEKKMIEEFEVKQRIKIFNPLPFDITKKQKRRIKFKRRRLLRKRVRTFKAKLRSGRTNEE